MAAVLAIAPVRRAVAGWLGLRGVRIEQPIAPPSDPSSTAPSSFTAADETAAASVDGRQLYVLTSTGKLVTIDTNTQLDQPTDPAVVQVTDIGQISTTGRPALALNARTLYAGLDNHLVTVDLTSGTITQSSIGQMATALAISPTANAVLAANDASIWRLNSSDAPVHLPTHSVPSRC
jgi:hypothetical protein